MTYLASKIRQRQVWTKPMSKMDECKQLIHKTLLAHVPVSSYTQNYPNLFMKICKFDIIKISIKYLSLKSKSKGNLFFIHFLQNNLYFIKMGLASLPSGSER